MPAYQYARVSLSGDGAHVWAMAQVFPDPQQEFRQDEESYTGFAQSIANLGAQGFDLVTIVNDPENADGVWRETWIFRRAIEGEANPEAEETP